MLHLRTGPVHRTHKRVPLGREAPAPDAGPPRACPDSPSSHRQTSDSPFFFGCGTGEATDARATPVRQTNRETGPCTRRNSAKPRPLSLVAHQSGCLEKFSIREARALAAAARAMRDRTPRPRPVGVGQPDPARSRQACPGGSARGAPQRRKLWGPRVGDEAPDQRRILDAACALHTR